MKIKMFKRWQAVMIMGLGLMLASCSDPTSTPNQAQPQLVLTPQISLLDHPGKVMASNCFQCHGTDGKNGVFSSLVDKVASEIIKEMKELQVTTEAEKAIMKVHALAYSDEQIALIADYFDKAQ